MKKFQIDYTPIAQAYAREQLSGTLYLAFRDIPQLFKTFLPSKTKLPLKFLDFGCGTGVSTRFLESLDRLFPPGIEVHGTDINEKLIQLAQEEDPHGQYSLIKEGKIESPDEYYDAIFSTFVLFEFASKNQMQKAFEEIRRVLKKGGIFIAVTGSAEGYNRQNQWVSLNVDFPQNDSLKSGELGRVDFKIHGQSLTFQNYFWTQEDYCEVFKKAGFTIQKIHLPLGFPEEENIKSWKWKSETNVSPYYIFIVS